MPTVHVPPPYRGPTQGRETIEVAGATIRECIEAVDAYHPGFAAQIFDHGARLRSLQIAMEVWKGHESAGEPPPSTPAVAPA